MTSYVTFTDEIISSCPKLKAISINLTGYNFIVLASENKNDVKVAVISEYCTQEVSEHAFSLALAVARKSQGFGMKMIAFSPSCPASVADELGIILVDKWQLFRESNFICLTMSLNKENTQILNQQALIMMEKKPIIINVSRGQMIDEDALVYALDNNIIFGAGLDVLVDETEQYISNSSLTGRNNVILTPHATFYSDFLMQENQRIGVSNLVIY